MGTHRLALGLLIGAMMADPAAARALEPIRELRQEFRKRVWDREHGLPDSVVRCLTQTPDGYLWVGTFGGLARFDGARFVAYTPADTPWLPRRFIVSLFTDRMGRLWVGTDQQVIVRDGGAWRVLGSEAGWPGTLVESIAEGPEGVVLCSTGTRLYRLIGERFEEFPGPERPPGDQSPVRPIRDAAGVVWARTDRLLARWQSDRWQTIVEAEEGKPFLGLAPARDGGVWLADSSSVRRFSEGHWHAPRAFPPHFRDSLVQLLEDGAGNLWVGGFYHGLVIFLADGRTLAATTREGLSHSHVPALFEDAEGNIFAGTGGGGLMQFTPRRVRVFHGDNEMSADNRVKTVGPDGANAILFGTEQGGLFHLERGATQLLLDPTRHPWGKDPLRVALRTRDGTLWVATEAHGLWHGKGSNWSAIPAEQLPGGPIQALFEDAKGALWVGSMEGVAVGRGDAFARYSGAGTAPGRVSAFVEGRDGTVWLAASAGLFRAAAGVLEHVAALEFRDMDERPVALHCDSRGDLWVGSTSGALYRLHEGAATRIGREQGLQAQAIGAILGDADDNLWLATMLGILRIPRASLDAVTDGSTAHFECLLCDRADGLLSNDCYLGSQPAATRTADGRLWFGTHRGVAVIDPRTFRVDRRPLPVWIEEVWADGQRCPVALGEADKVVVAAGAKQVRVGFTGIGLAEPDKVRLQYRWHDEDDWMDAGKERQALLIDVRPHSYAFQVRAANRDGVWNDVGARLTLQVLPHFWQTRWFAVLAVAAGLASVGGLVARAERLRLRRRLERVRQQEALAVERARSAALLATTPDLVAFIRPDGRLLSLNEAGRRLLGWQPGANAADATFLELFAAPSAELLRREALPMAQAGGAWRGDAVVRALDGREAPVALVLLGHKEGCQEVDFLSAVARDTTERMQAEKLRNTLELQLRQSQKMEAIGTLAGGIAHDFNNLLTVIIGQTELALLAGGPALPVRAHLDAVRRTGQRAAELVRRILTFSRKQDEQRDVMQLEPVVREVLTLLRSTLPATTEIAAHFGPCPNVLASPTQIQQVVMNLCTNAQHAMAGQAGRIDVRLAPREVDAAVARQHADLHEGCYVLLAVADNGRGMDDATLARIFEPFFTTKGRGQGTGLGLAVVHGIVKQLGGAVAVQSTPARGTTFEVYFPAVRKVAEPPKPPSGALPPGHGEEVLALDDDPEVLQFVANLLRHLGYRVTACSSPEEALAQFRSNPERFRAVLTDLTMPRLTGVEVARQIRALNPHIAILLATGLGDSLDEARALDHGFRAFLNKPYQAHTLATVLAAALQAPAVP